MCNSLYVKVRFLRNMQNTFDFLFSNRQKQSFGFISRSQRRYSLFMKSKQRSGRIETDCYENSQKRIAYRNYSLIPGRGRLCAKVQKRFFSRRQTPSPLKTVCGWRTQTSSLYADSLNARSLYKCVKTGKWNLHPLPRALPTLLYSRSNTCSISLLLYKTLPPST